MFFGKKLTSEIIMQKQEHLEWENYRPPISISRKIKLFLCWAFVHIVICTFYRNYCDPVARIYIFAKNPSIDNLASIALFQSNVCKSLNYSIENTIWLCYRLIK